MSINRVAVISILVLLTLTANIHAQTPSVTASVTPEGTVRMMAHGEALQVRMEVYSATGELVADTGLRQGNIIDWKQTTLPNRSSMAHTSWSSQSKISKEISINEWQH